MQENLVVVAFNLKTLTSRKIFTYDLRTEKQDNLPLEALAARQRPGFGFAHPPFTPRLTSHEFCVVLWSLYGRHWATCYLDQVMPFPGTGVPLQKERAKRIVVVKVGWNPWILKTYFLPGPHFPARPSLGPCTRKGTKSLFVLYALENLLMVNQPCSKHIKTGQC